MLFAMDEKEFESENQSQTLKYCAIKLWETMKIKLVYNMEVSQINDLINWIAEMLLVLLEEDHTSVKSEQQGEIINKVY